MGKAKKRRAAARKLSQKERESIARGRAYSEVELFAGCTADARRVAKSLEFAQQTLNAQLSSGALDEWISEAVLSGKVKVEDPTGKLSQCDIAKLPVVMKPAKLEGPVTVQKSSPSVVKQITQTPYECAVEARNEIEKDNFFAYLEFVQKRIGWLVPVWSKFILDQWRDNGCLRTLQQRLDGSYLYCSFQDVEHGWHVEGDTNAVEVFNEVSEAVYDLYQSNAVGALVNISKRILTERLLELSAAAGVPLPDNFLCEILKHMQSFLAEMTLSQLLNDILDSVKEHSRSEAIRLAGYQSKHHKKSTQSHGHKGAARCGNFLEHFEEASERINETISTLMESVDSEKRKKALRRRLKKKQNASISAQSSDLGGKSNDPSVKLHDVHDSKGLVRRSQCDRFIDMHGCDEIGCIDKLRGVLLRICIGNAFGVPIGVITGKGLHSRSGKRVVHEAVDCLLEGWGCTPIEKADGFVFTLTKQIQSRIMSVHRDAH